jgi:hypothetical protein
MKNPLFKHLKNYQIIAMHYNLKEELFYPPISKLDADMSRDDLLVALETEIEAREIRLTIGLVKRWWHRYANAKGRMEWKQPSGYQHWWEKGTKAVYTEGAASIVYSSLAAIVSDIETFEDEA